MERRGTTIWVSFKTAQALRDERKAHESHDDVIQRLLAEVGRAREILGPVENEPISIDIPSFLAYCRGLMGEMLPTAGGQSEFQVTSVKNGRIGIRISSGREKGIGEKWISRVFKEYRQSKSLHPADYPDTLGKASYTLALIKGYLEQEARPSSHRGARTR